MTNEQNEFLCKAFEAVVHKLKEKEHAKKTPRSEYNYSDGIVEGTFQIFCAGYILGLETAKIRKLHVPEGEDLD